jgi:RNA polymerase sigma factor (sigma-70 family)
MPLSSEVSAIVPSTSSDVTLVEAARRGDRSAFAELLDRHRPMLLALIRRTLDGSGAVDDLAQEAAVAAWLGMGRLRQPERFGSWLAGIGLNIARHWCRSRQEESWSWEALSGGELLDRSAAPLLDPAEVVGEREFARRVREAVAELPPGQRDATLLFYLDGLTLREMAVLLGVEVSAIKARLFKARKALRRRLYRLWKEDAMDRTDEMVEMRIIRVIRLPAEGDRPPEFVIMLEEIEGSGDLPIWVGQSEATWLALTLEKVELPRPGPYAMAAELLASLGSRVREARIERLADSTYYAVVVAGRDGVTTRIDARPSDALNLAALTGSPVLASQDIVFETSADVPWRERLEKQLDEGTAAGTATVAAEAQEEWQSSLKRFSTQTDY